MAAKSTRGHKAKIEFGMEVEVQSWPFFSHGWNTDSTVRYAARAAQNESGERAEAEERRFVDQVGLQIKRPQHEGFQQLTDRGPSLALVVIGPAGLEVEERPHVEPIKDPA